MVGGLGLGEIADLYVQDRCVNVRGKGEILLLSGGCTDLFVA